MSDESKGRNNKIIIAVILAAIFSCCCCGVGFFGAISTGAFTRFNARIKADLVGMNPLAKARADDRVIALLGAPITQEGAPQGELGTIADGVADYSRRLSGPKGVGTLVIKARKVHDTWIYEAVRVEVGEESIDLMPVTELKVEETSR